MRTLSTYDEWIGVNVYNMAGDKVGTLSDIYCDDDTGEPEFVTVATDLIGTKSGIIPIAGSAPYEDGLRVPFTTDQINDAPTIGTDEQLDKHDEQRLHAYYDLTNRTEDVTTSARPDEAQDVARARSADHGNTVTRPEEHRDEVEAGRGRRRLRRYVATEEVTVTVPVEKLVERVVRNPAPGTAAEAPVGDDHDEVVLARGEVVVDNNGVADQAAHRETGSP